MSNWTELCNTKISGVTSGPNADDRQWILEQVRDAMSWNWARKPHLEVGLVHDETNEFDADAIEVYIQIPDDGRPRQVGFVKNSETICRACGCQFERHPNSRQCPECKKMGHLERMGTATRLAKLIREGVKLRAVITEVTGGGDKSFGANLRIFRQD